MTEADQLRGAGDPDTHLVLQIFEGAQRSAGDPDRELAAILPEIEGTKDPQDLVRRLRGLVRDAHKD